MRYGNNDKGGGVVAFADVELAGNVNLDDRKKIPSQGAGA